MASSPRPRGSPDLRGLQKADGHSNESEFSNTQHFEGSSKFTHMQNTANNAEKKRITLDENSQETIINTIYGGAEGDEVANYAN